MLADALTVSEVRLVGRLVPAGFPFGELVGTSRKVGPDRTGWSHCVGHYCFCAFASLIPIRSQSDFGRKYSRTCQRSRAM